MRPTKIIFLLVFLCMIAWLVVWLSPFVSLVLAHPSKDGIVTDLLTRFLVTKQPDPASNPMVWIFFGLGIVLFVTMELDMRLRKRMTHGSAHHANRREARKYRAPRPPVWQRQGRALAPATTGRRAAGHQLILGKYKGQDIALSEQQQYQHLLLVAPTGAGKSARFIIPNLLREKGSRSLFIADLKNELYKVTAGWLNQYMQIWLFAPLNPTISAGYNPLAHIHSVEEAQDFAETWVLNTGTSSKESFWDTNSKLLISAMVLHLVETEKKPAFFRLAEMLTTRSYEEVRDTLRGSRSHNARYIAAQFLESMEKNERLIGSQMADVGNRFQLLASPSARAITATNDIDFQEMIETPTAFFLSIPRNATRRYRPLMAVLTQQMFGAWEQNGTQGMACYLDEFTNLGYIPGYGEFISTARALKVSLMMAIQNFSQLDERYNKNDAETIKANAVTHLLLPGAGLEECRYYSERIGDTTIATETINRRGYGLSEEITSSQSEARRRLMTPDEIRTMPEDKMLMVEAKSAPLLLTTTLYFQDRKLKQRANLPNPVTQIRQEPPTAPQGLPAPSGLNQTIVDGDVEDENQADQFFQGE